MNFDTYHAINALLSASAQLLDSKDSSTWPDLFISTGSYKLQSRENHERGLPLCLMDLESQGMLRDRVHAAQDTIYHDPYTQCHVCGAPSIRLLEDVIDDGYEAEDYEVISSFIVTRVQHGKMPEILAVGRYIDVVARVAGSFKFKSRLAVYDNNLLPNSVIKPI